MLEGKFKCLETGIGTLMSIGSIYIFKNGTAKLDKGYTSFSYKSLEDFHSRNISMKLVQCSFTKSDLKDGDYVIHRDGKKSVVILKFNMILDIERRYLNPSNLRDDLTVDYMDEFDIMKVERDGKIIWEREEKSQRDIEIDDILAQIDVLSKRVDELRMVE